MPETSRHIYDADSLTLGLAVFERSYRMTSEEFYAAYRAERVPAEIPGFDCHVWASFYEDVRRLRGDEPESVLGQVERVFASA